MCRRQQAEKPAVQAKLGLDFLGKGTLCGGRGGQVPRGGAETSWLPGRDFVC